jgi:uncharacterized membrane protein YdjX (TVP38/TMEM64 family)
VLSTLLGRLTPVAPFTLVSYAGGLSGIRFRDHLLGTAIGLVPGTVLHVGVGATVGAAGELGGWTLLASALPFAVVGTVLVVRWLRRRRLTRSAAV